VIVAERDKSILGTVKKAMDVLDLLGASPEPLSASEISTQLSLPRSTTYRLLATLKSGGYVSQDPSDATRFRLGFHIAELASRLLSSIELREQAMPALTRLRDLAEENIHLVVMDDGQVTYIDKVECRHAVRMHSAIGAKGYAHSTAVGKAMLAHMPMSEVEEIVEKHGMPASTPNTITDLQSLKKQLVRIKERGYSIDNIENEEGIRCIGAPIFDHTGAPVAALSVSGPAYRFSMRRVSELADAVMEAAREISGHLGSSNR
jgi:DNA-binding IclR family transcriptional regulator